jgi:hypothetical protein
MDNFIGQAERILVSVLKNFYTRLYFQKKNRVNIFQANNCKLMATRRCYNDEAAKFTISKKLVSQKTEHYMSVRHRTRYSRKVTLIYI